MGRYYYRGETTSLPVEEGHPWHEAWERFAGIHGGLGPEVTRLLTADPADRRTLPALARLLRVYGAKLTTRSYLDGLSWLPEGLKEIIAIHTLNAGVAPMPDACAVREHARDHGQSMACSCLRAASTRSCSPWRGSPGAPGSRSRRASLCGRSGRGKVVTAEREYAADAVVSDLDSDRLERLLDPGKERAKERLSCSGVAVYAALRKSCRPGSRRTASCCLPTPAALYASLEAGEEPRETMAFVNYYRGGEIYPNDGGTLAVLLTAPANGREYGLEDPFVSAGDRTRLRAAAGLPGTGDQIFR